MVCYIECFAQDGRARTFMIGHVKMGYSGIPLKYMRDQFSAESERGDTKTMHLGDGHDRIFVHAWNEPGWRNGKPPKKPAKVMIANCFTGAPVAPWRKDRTYLKPDGTVEKRFIDIPQSESISVRRIESIFTINTGRVFWLLREHGILGAGICACFRL